MTLDNLSKRSQTNKNYELKSDSKKYQTTNKQIENKPFYNKQTDARNSRNHTRKHSEQDEQNKQDQTNKQTTHNKAFTQNKTDT